MTAATLFPAVFVLLYAAHHLSDYPLQTDHQAAHKAARSVRGWIANQAHAATHTLTSAALLGLGTVLLNLTLSTGGTAAALAWIHLSHSAIDRRRAVAWWMDHTGQRAFRERGGAAYVDQAAHIGLGLAPAALWGAVL